MDMIPWQGQREKVFLDRYATKDFNGTPTEQTPEEMWLRVSKAIAGDKREQSLFYTILDKFQFVPGGRILAGERSLYNCFVLGFESGAAGADSRGSIMSTIGNLVEITAQGGGVGINWSTLRPRNTYIKGVSGRSSGSTSWMRGGDGLADVIRQGGSRTAALMFMLDDWHPDIVEFTRAISRFKRANFSVNISDEFMRAVKHDADWNLVFPDTNSPFYDCEWNGDIQDWKNKQLPVIVHDTVRARSLWKAMAESAHMIGSPGLAFMDRCNEWSNTRYLHKLICFNPCGEQPLNKNGSCNLGSLNLLSFMNNGEFSFDRLKLIIRYAVRFLDRAIDVNEDITKDIGDMQRKVRRIGLGTMGLADILVLHGIKYGSDESISFIHKLYSFIRDAAYEASINLAKEKGPAPGFHLESILKSKFIKTLPEELIIGITRHGLRNLSLLTNAPTGTTSILAGASSGIEPIFSREYTRKDNTGCTVIKHPLADDPAMVTAKNIDICDQIRVQSVIQMYMDASISKTINLPETCTIEDIMKAYELAYDLNCKGITVYRANSLEDILCESCNL